MPESVRAAELALRLHQTDKPYLRFELEPGTVVIDDQPPVGYVLTKNAIKLASLAERNRHVAGFTYKGFGENMTGAPDLLNEHAYKLWRREIGHVDHAAGRLIAFHYTQVRLASGTEQKHSTKCLICLTISKFGVTRMAASKAVRNLLISMKKKLCVMEWLDRGRARYPVNTDGTRAGKRAFELPIPRVSNFSQAR